MISWGPLAMNHLLRTGILLCVSFPAWAQVSKPTAEDAQITKYDIPGGAGFRTEGLSNEPGLSDLRDFSGTWDNQGGNVLAGFLRMRAAQARGADPNTAFAQFINATPDDMGAPAAVTDPSAGGPAGGPGGSAPGSFGPGENQTYKRACMPSVGVVTGGDGPVELIQTSDQLTWMAEEMHSIRRIFLKGTFTPNMPPTYLGEAVGHFDGDTLVVETRGMKSLGAGVRMFERISKSDEGRVLHDEVTYVNADGRPARAAQQITLYYRPKAKMMEWICEDNGQVYQTGLDGEQL
jgi:hypothetical protein